VSPATDAPGTVTAVEEGSRSDDVPGVLATGDADVGLAVFSLSAASPDGLDDEYIRWHLLDHLPEQYRLARVRSGRRWRSTAVGRAARAASATPFDAVDHVVGYLFSEPVDEAIDGFFGLAAALHGAGRMPIRLPSVHLAAWRPVARRAADRLAVGADVLPFRPNRGVYLVVEERGSVEPDLAAVLDVPGVAGWWRFHGEDDRHRGLASAGDLALTVLELDDDPTSVAHALAPVVATSWPDGAVRLAAPFEPVTVPW
jgi:hypothetical protein